jgi:hypothetical protein
MRTEDLVKTLAVNAEPVTPLPSPHVRMLIWFSISVAYAALVVLLVGPRPDLAERLADVRFVVEVAAAFMVSMLAAAAAFCAECPGRPLWERFAPVPAIAVWLGTLGDGCWRAWIQEGPSGLTIMPDFLCFPSIVLISLVPAILILAMIRRGAPIAPVSTTALAMLAAAALGAAALRLFHTQDASIMVLVWQFGSVAILALLGALFGRRFLRWSHVR